MKWKRTDGCYQSEDGRFEIMKSSLIIYSGLWELHDNKTDKDYYETYIEDAKHRAESIMINQ